MANQHTTGPCRKCGGTERTKHGQCKACRKISRRKYNERMAVENQKKRVKKRQEWMDEYKRDRPCTDCGVVLTPRLMHWDHLPGFEKIMEVSRMVARARSEKRILEEVAKCELVCVNCHAKRGVEREQLVQWGRT